ncbi:MAG: SMP-30/gluconolactonase/LRE family protein [Cyclobacteriaceae bacterium]|nr:SMP-30/gluconolactonase/LRE family protein [Cyclobacteriaceae bacterium]
MQKRKIRNTGYALAALLTLLIVFVSFYILIPAGFFKTIKPHFAGAVEKIAMPISGPEDITVDRQLQLAFISCDDRRNGSTGGIFVLDLNDSSHALRHVTPTLSDFHPHGISLFRNEKNQLFLFAVNHRKKPVGHAIEKFEWRNDSLVHQESFLDPVLMTSPNDVTAVSERTFYVTNDHGNVSGFKRTLEEYLQLPQAYVNYFDGHQFVKAAEHIAYANGINHSLDGVKIFVATPTGRKIVVYNRDIPTGTLTREEEIFLHSGVDNIELDEEGNLWTGCHPKLLRFVAHSKDSTAYSPSQVLKVVYKPGEPTIEEIFLNDGKQYSGSSVAAVYGNTLIIGSVFEHAILWCTIRQD